MISSLAVERFRNLSSLTVPNCGLLNEISGENGSGKTSLLEALYFIGTLSSFRTKKVSCLIQNNYSLCALTLKKHLPSQQNISYEVRIQHDAQSGDRSPRIATSIDSKQFSNKLSYLLHKADDPDHALFTLCFSPSQHALLTQSPEHRRRYFNHMLYHFEPSSLEVWSTYYKILKQRNALLKAHSLRGQASTLFEVYTEQLVEAGAYLLDLSLNLTRHLNAHLATQATRLGAPSHALRLHYAGALSDPSPEQSVYKDALRQRYKTLFRREQELRTTLLGPHRDDWSLIQNEKDLRHWGSQGEAKTALLALKFSEAIVLQQQKQKFPILLLDDLSAELDTKRQSNTLEVLEDLGLQAFISSTSELPSSSSLLTRYRLQKGALLPL